MNNLPKQILKEVLLEGFFTKGKIAFWIEEIPGLVKVLGEVQKEAKKYLDEVKKKYPDNVDTVALEIQIETDSTLSTIVSKQKRGKGFVTIELIDGNGVLDNNFKIKSWKFESILIGDKPETK